MNPIGMIETIKLNAQITPKVKLKTIALPVEHGGWGFLFEPVVLGLLLAPSIGGLFLSLATVAAFLTRHPLKLRVMDLRRGRVSARTHLTRNFALMYGITSLFFFLLTIKTSGSGFLLPLLIALPFALCQLVADFANKSRNLSAEIAGAIAIASVSSSILIIAGWSLVNSLCIWLILITRIVPSILFVRAKIQTIHGVNPDRGIVIIVHALALIIVSLIVWKGFGTTPAWIILSVLLVRAVHGLTSYSKAKTAKAVGVRELIYGTLTVFALVIGYGFNL